MGSEDTLAPGLAGVNNHHTGLWGDDPCPTEDNNHVSQLYNRPCILRGDDVRCISKAGH